MTPQDFITKWRNTELKERSASQSHFIDLCRLLDIEDPTCVCNICFEEGVLHFQAKQRTNTSNGKAQKSPNQE